MNANAPVDPRVRLAITQWADDAPRGAVTSFCLEQGITRKTFYKIRERARIDGPAAALEPRSRQPRSSPARLSDEVKREALQVRAALERSGLDHGPISVHDKMRALGLRAPSTAALARIFREAGVARIEPKKRPRAAYRRFVYPAPNCLWQLDATEYVLTRGRKCVIFQLIDDHSRFAIASHVAGSETAHAAVTVMRKGIAAHGVPVKLLSDNGLALNPSRRGYVGKLVSYVTSLGVEAITGKPYKPTTQGKNERFHQTLMRYLDKQPLADSLRELQSQVDAFDEIYNSQRPHQSLPGRITPSQSYQATPKADPPRPRPRDAPVRARTRAETYLMGEAELTVANNGRATVFGTEFQIGARFIKQQVKALWDSEVVQFFAVDGELLLVFTKPPRRTKRVAKRDAVEIGPQARRVSPMS